MKALMPWFLLAATTSPVVYALNGLEIYRQGDYQLAAKELINQTPQDPLADYYLGRMRLYGYGQLKNNALALRYMTQAAEKNILPAQQLLARYSLFEEKNPEKALYWFKKAALLGDLKAQVYCATANLFGFGTKQNSDQARRYYIEAARAGDAIAQYSLGLEFLQSRDLRNKKLGLIWVNKAVDQGNPKAQCLLAEVLSEGKLLAQDSAKASELLHLSATQGYLPAMVMLGEKSIKDKDWDTAKQWLAKAAAENDSEAEISLAHLYLNTEAKFYNPKTAFMWMVQAAQNGSSKAQEELALLYKEGKGIEINPTMALKWQEAAKTANPNKPSAAMQVSKWLSNDRSTTFNIEGYRLGGIYSAWKNPLALKENNYNQAPQMDKLTRKELYQPQFTMIQPQLIAINDYFDVLAPALNSAGSDFWAFPRYSLDKRIEELLSYDSQVLKPKPFTSLVERGVNFPSELGLTGFDYLDEASRGWKQQANYQLVLSQLYGQAILGDSTAQFELGQLYQYGIGVAKNAQQAITYYQLAAMQQEIKAEYNLGILYLEGQTNPLDYQTGIKWLMDAAFKGNKYAQYALANIYEKGLRDATGTIVVAPDSQQAEAMYYLASANHYGPAQYHLADYLVKEPQKNLSVSATQTRNKLIKRLYQGAAKKGIAEATLPLAFYNAMDKSAEKQLLAFNVAKKEAEAGNNNAALLLAVMYERGIATTPDEAQSLYWYQQAALNPVNAFVLGTYYSEGRGVGKDLEKGKALLQQAADAGFSYALLNLAILKQQQGEDFLTDLAKARELGNPKAGLLLADYYLEKAEDSENMQQAREIYQQFAEKGDKDAQLKLAYLYEQGLGGATNYDNAAKWYSLAAEQGQPIAQYLLGQLYQLGQIGTQPDYKEAKKWYEAARLVYPRASVALGFIYDTVEDNYEKAFENYQLAAQKDDAAGLLNLGLLYENGKDRPVDYNQAQLLYTKAADLGNGAAMTQLGQLYFMGLNGKRDEQEALGWYTKAAALGDSDALYQLGLFSETGVATKLDFSNALHYYQQAASLGNEKAKLALARMYQYGLGVSKNNQQAMELYKELAANNNAYAQYQLALNHFEGEINPVTTEEKKRLLQQASTNGSQQARKMLQWLEAQQQQRLSFIEPVVITHASSLKEGQPADLMYFEAINEWNRGDEMSSRRILDRLMTEYPQYVPAKRTYEQMKQKNREIIGLI